jgi:plasmid stabilization system protein ParE
MKVRYTATALEEIEDILTNIARDNSSAALRVSVTILATIDRVAEFPHTAVEADVPGVRVAPVLPYRYLIFVSIANDVLIVRNVRHSARQREL